MKKKKCHMKKPIKGLYNDRNDRNDTFFLKYISI